MLRQTLTLFVVGLAMTHFVNPKEVEGDLVAHLVAVTDGGADYSFECVGNVNLMTLSINDFT